MDQASKPPLFSAKSLRILTKIVAIYAGFYVVTVIAQSISQPVSENPMASSNSYVPLYVLAAFHLVLGLIHLAIILSKRYNWAIPLLSAALMIAARIYYLEIATWVWSWS